MNTSIRQALRIEPGEHPPYEQLAQLVDGTADDVTREIVESHAGACAQCEEELRDLRAFAGGPAWPVVRWLGAAAAMIAVFIAGWYLLRRRPVVRAEKPTVRERSVPAVPQTATGYGRDDWDSAVRTAVERGAIDAPPIVAELRAQRDVLRGSGQSAPAIMNPVGEVIDSTTPELTWRADPGRFIVSVYDGVERVAGSATLRTPRWRVSPPLPRGRTYTWQVEVVRGDTTELLAPPPAPPAFFHVLDSKTSASLAAARQHCPRDPLLLGVLYARAGLRRMAIEELRAAGATPLVESVQRW